MIHFPLFLCPAMLHFFLYPLFRLRWARVGQWLSPTAQIHPTRVRQPAHLPLAHLRRWNLHLHGEQLQRHRWGVCWPRGLGWVCGNWTDKAFHILLKTHTTDVMSSKRPWNSSHSFYLVVCLFNRGWETRSCPLIIKLCSLLSYTKAHSYWTWISHCCVFFFCKKPSRNKIKKTAACHFNRNEFFFLLFVRLFFCYCSSQEEHFVDCFLFVIFLISSLTVILFSPQLARVLPPPHRTRVLSKELKPLWHVESHMTPV